MARRGQTVTEALKKAIADSGLTYSDIERETGVKRASVLRFMRGERTLRLDMADRLVAFFGIEIRRKGR
jgi:plasmid maintenance system antidote protein VapI